jgi:hypothetical protein
MPSVVTTQEAEAGLLSMLVMLLAITALIVDSNAVGNQADILVKT